jgi:dGTPase
VWHATFGRALGLNLDLIEAIALGHDIGHTPFGHAGERFLNQVFHERTGRWFFHNVQSVRVLDVLYGRNLSLQTLDGVICHNGEFEQQEFHTSGLPASTSSTAGWRSAGRRAAPP